MSYQLAIFIDQNKCIDCKSCLEACIFSNKRGITLNNNTPGSDHFSNVCVHCQNPVCVAVCPEKNFQKRYDGIVIRQANRCRLCFLCINSCPFNAISLNPETNNIEKCDFCVERIDQGVEPLCIDCCATGALSLIKIDPAAPSKNKIYFTGFNTPIMSYSYPAIVFSEK